MFSQVGKVQRVIPPLPQVPARVLGEPRGLDLSQERERLGEFVPQRRLGPGLFEEVGDLTWGGGLNAWRHLLSGALAGWVVFAVVAFFARPLTVQIFNYYQVELGLLENVWPSTQLGSTTKLGQLTRLDTRIRGLHRFIACC